jgi:succinoglycan biosynthesis protein ExoA
MSSLPEPASAPPLFAPAAELYPSVTVIMPVLNEGRHLREAVAHVLAQDYPGALELVLALGPSTDDTDAVAAELARDHDRVRTVPNPTGRTPNGLNAAIAAGRHDVFVRVDGHAILPPAYVRTAVRTLAETGADNVGGIMAAEGETPFEQAVARAMTSPLGVGSARYHTGGGAGPAPSVYLGVFRRAILERTGGYDESFVRAQDWELNHRIREAGGLVWFTPELRVSYRPRPSYRALARQYYDYGRWRRVVMRRHAGTASPRYLAPPAALVGTVGGLLLGLSGRRLGYVVPAAYAAALVAGAAVISRQDPPVPASGQVHLPAVLATMHMSWAAGFLTSPSGLGD